MGYGYQLRARVKLTSRLRKRCDRDTLWYYLTFIAKSPYFQGGNSALLQKMPMVLYTVVGVNRKSNKDKEKSI